MGKEILWVESLSKSFPGVKALHQVSVGFEKGAVTVLLGENGAGKSTLIKILAGIYHSDSGQIYYRGKEVVWRDASHALCSGISVIHQELSVINDLTVAENIFLGRETKRGILLNKRAMVEKTQTLLEYLQLSISPRSLIKDLSAAERQMVEIARAISCDASVVIMDEPTSSLSATETETLFRVIAELKRKDVCIIYISHRMSEIKRIGDAIVIMKDGCLVEKVSPETTDEKDWIRKMVGRDIRRLDAGKQRMVSSEVVLAAQNITSAPYCCDVSFELHKGEILGISGLVGAGRTELLRAIFGADKRQSGEIFIHGTLHPIRNTQEAIGAGIALVPEDRRGQGLLLERNIVENISLPSHRAWRRHGLIDGTRGKTAAEKYIQLLSIKIASLKSAVKFMSGGNQQKAVLSKWLAADCTILFMDEPTRGIDVNAKNEIYTLMLDFTKNGGSIVMVSSELPEILGVSDRILVMREGRCVACMDKNSASEQDILAAASIN